MQIAQRLIARAEIVEREFDAERAQAVHHPRRRFAVFHHVAFRNFGLQAARGESGRFECGGDALEQIGLRELFRRQIGAVKAGRRQAQNAVATRADGGSSR